MSISFQAVMKKINSFIFISDKQNASMLWYISNGAGLLCLLYLIFTEKHWQYNIERN